MATDPLEEDATPRLNRISEELNAVDSEIIANLETLPDQKELVERLISRCDGIALELDAIQMELGGLRVETYAEKNKSEDVSADGSGLKP